MARYLRQLKTGRLYIWNRITAERKDMVEFDPDKAKVRIVANQRILEEYKGKQTPEQEAAHSEETADAARIAAELTATENAIDSIGEPQLPDAPPDQKPQESPEDAEAQRRRDLIDNDEEIKQIEALGTGADLVKYIEKEYGEKYDARKMKPEELRTIARKLRVGRIMEEVR
jgi:hypothetical protein